MTRRDPATLGNGPTRRPRRLVPTCPRPDCDGELVKKRDGDYVVTRCISCGHDATYRYAPEHQLETKEPQLTRGLEMYCDLRRRSYTHGAIRGRTGWSHHYLNLLLEEASRRGMKGSNEDRDEAFREWLLEMHDSGMNLTEIYRLSGRSNLETRTELTEALEAARYIELERWTAARENYADADFDCS